MTDNDALLTPEEVAEWLHVPVATLRYWRHARKGPRSFRIGGLLRYKLTDVEAWIAAQYADAVGDDL